jgi:hypothetical protein
MLGHWNQGDYDGLDMQLKLGRWHMHTNFWWRKRLEGTHLEQRVVDGTGSGSCPVAGLENRIGSANQKFATPLQAAERRLRWNLFKSVCYGTKSVFPFHKGSYVPVWWLGNKNSPTVTHACRKRRLKWVPGAWGYNWATLPMEDINTEAWSSRVGVGRGATTLPCKKKIVEKPPRNSAG